MKRYLLILLVALCTLSVVGCRSSRRLEKKHQKEQAEQVVRDTNAATQPTTPSAPSTGATPSKPEQKKENKRQRPFDTFSGSFTCEVQGMNVNGLVRLQYDSVIWVCLNKFIELGRVRITPDSVVAYIRPTNQYVRATMKEMQQQHGLDIDFYRLQSLLLGQPISSKTIQCMPSNYTTISGQNLARTLAVNVLDRRMRTSTTIKYSTLKLNEPITTPVDIPRRATPFKL